MRIKQTDHDFDDVYDHAAFSSGCAYDNHDYRANHDDLSSF